MNWGIKITIAYSVFVIGILYLCVRAAGEQFDLVEPNYYQAELQYQQRIDEQKRTASLSSLPKIIVSNKEVSILFPSEFTNKKKEGELYLYCPSDAKKDYKIGFQSVENYSMKLPDGVSGYYQIKIRWKADEQFYSYEESRIL